MWKNNFKRVCDLVAAALLLTILAPVLACIFLLVRLSMGSPALFLQRRPGYRGQPFTMIKFRTMKESANPGMESASDEKRLTSVGRFLRSTSLDELPELINVLCGHMSLVGPRPLLMEYVELYSSEENRRHEVKPGITGWAQIHGRNCQSWEERFRLDLWYVQHCGMWLDLRILALTAWKVARREGISADGHATMPAFRRAQRVGESSSEIDRRQEWTGEPVLKI